MSFYYRPKIHISKIVRLAFISFLICIAISGISTIWAAYIKSFVFNDSLVGFTTALLTAISFLFSFIIPPILEKTKKVKIFSYTLIFVIISYILFSVIKEFYLFLIIAIVLTIVNVFRYGSYGVMIRNESKLKDIGKNEGLKYTFVNLGYILGPLTAGFIAAKFGMNIIFLFAAAIIFITLLYFSTLRIKETKLQKESSYNIFKNLKHYFSDSSRTKAYILKAGVAIWWGIVYIFLPLLILRNGLGIEWVGIALFGINVPLLLLEYPLSRIADKKGFRKFFIIGFLILSIISIAVFFSSSIYLIIALLIVASIGAACVEPLAEAYFFKIVPKTQENKYYAPFLTSVDAGVTVGNLIASVVIILIAFNYIFIFLALEMLFFLFIALTIKEKIK